MNALHAAIDAMVNAVQARQDDVQLLALHQCWALVEGYDALYRHEAFETISAEQTMIAPLVNPSTNAQSKTFQMAGKLDVIAMRDGRRILIDHKTTSQSLAPDSPYWDQLVVEGQVNHYMLLSWAHDQKFDSALWDCIRRPMTAPKKLTKAERASVIAEGTYFGDPVLYTERQQLQTDDRETPAMYRARLAHDCTVVRPEWYFARRAVPRLDAEIFEYARELWLHTQDILHTRRSPGLPPRNSGACLQYNSACKFLGICSGHDTPESDKWQKKMNVHPELPLDYDGGDLLTNSRIRCFQTCRRKHYYQFDLGIERQDAEEKAAIFFGSLMHVGLEAWWLAFKKETDNGNGESAAPGGPAATSGTGTNGEEKLPGGDSYW